MPTNKSNKKRPKKAADKGHSIPVPGRIEVAPPVETKTSAGSDIKTAPILEGADPKVTPETSNIAKHKAAAKIVKHHAVKHIRILQAKTVGVAIKVGSGYKKADAKAVHIAKKTVPVQLRQRLADNRAANEGDVRFYVPLPPKIIPRKVPVVISAKVKHIRHAALPIALIAVLAFAMHPAGAAPGYGGTKSIGGTGVDEAKHIAVDGSGNVYTTGNFTGTVDFAADWAGTDSKSSAGGTADVFVTKTNANGSYGWTKIIGGSDAGGDYGYGIAADSDGNVYVAGNFTGTVDFAADWAGTDEKTSAGGTDAFITKINSDGTYGDTWQVGGTAADTATSVATDGSSNVYVAGSFEDAVTFDADFGGSTDIKTSAGGSDAFVMQVTAAGGYGWGRHFGDTSSDNALSLAVDATNSKVYAAGTFVGTVNFAADWSDSDSKTSVAGTTDVSVTQLGTSGTYGWTKRLGDAGVGSAASVAVNSGGDVFVAGGFDDASVNFAADWSGSDTKASAGGNDGFVTKIASNGSYGWTHTIGSTGTESVSGVAIDADGNLYLSGSFGTSSVNFAADWSGSDTKTNSGLEDAFVTRLGGSGTYGWTVVFGASGSDQANSIAVDSSGSARLAGSFSETLDFAANFASTDSKVSAGDKDIFMTQVTNVPDIHTITDAAGLTFEDGSAVNLSSTGTTETNPLVYVRDQSDGTVLATANVDLSQNRDWSGASGDSDLTAHKMYLNDIIGAPGAAVNLTLYVPHATNDKAVIVCPGAQSLAAVSKTCANKITYTDNDTGVNIVTVDSQSYWTIDSVSDADIGAMSVAFPGATITETSGSTAVTEGGATDNISIRLNAQPTADVTVTVSTSIASQVAAIDPITFTTSNWDTPVQVLLTAVNNNTIDGNHSFSINYATESTDPNYDTTSENDVVSVAVTDNDTAGVTWNATDALTDEGGSTGTICATLTAQPSANVVLGVGSADTGEVTVGSSITIIPGNWNAGTNCITVTGVDDDTTDGPQDVAVSITSITGSDSNFSALDPANIAAATVTNQDNDTASFTVSSNPSAVTTEAAGTTNVCVQLSARPNSGSVTIPLSSSDTTEGSVASGSLVIAAADWNASDNCVTVTGVDDDMADGNVGYSVVTGDPTAADSAWNSLGASDIADISLTNNDNDVAGVTLTQSGGTTAVTEGGTTDTISVRLDSQPAPTKEVVVAVQPNAQLSTGSGAGVATSLTFTDANWSTPQSVTVTANDDISVEGAHSGSVAFTIDAATTETPYSGVSPQTINPAITDNDVATASITTTNDATESPASNGVFRVALSSQNNTGGNITLNYSIGGTATSGTHYTAFSGSVAVANGQSGADITVNVTGHNNALLEGNKTVIVTLTSSGSASAVISGTDDAATVVIFDDETATAALSTTQNGNETGPADIEYTVTLSKVNHTGSPITFSIDPTGGTATAASDYTNFASGTISVADGAGTGTMTVAVLNDALLEAATETIQATITNSSLAAVTIDTANDDASATITDNDTAAVDITASDPTATENPANSGEFTIALDKTNNTGSAVTVNYTVSGTATAGTDYTALSGSVTIADGQDSATVTVVTTSHDDNDQEGSETVTVTYDSTSLGGRVSAGGSDAATVTIADDEGAGVQVTATDDTTGEDGSTGQICFTLTSHPSANVTVALSSSDTSKVTVPSSVTITPANWNQSTNCITATGQNDTPPQATGTQDVTITTGAVSSSDSFYAAISANSIEDVVLHHADNDTAGVTVQTVSSDTREDGSKTATLRFSLSTQPTAAVTIPLSISDTGEGTLTGVTEIVIAAADWNTPAANEITVNGVDDNLTDGDINYQLVTGKPASSDAAYNALAASDVANPTLTNEDDDTASVSITASGGSTNVTEGGVTDTQSVSIGTQPASGKQVVITATPTNSQINLGAGAGTAIEKTFTNADWNTPQTVTVTAVDDSLLESTHSSGVVYTINTTSTDEPAYDAYGTALPTLSVAITDNETATANLSASNGTEAGPSDATFTVTLSATNNTGSAITFDLNPSGGTATATSDYTDFAGATLSIANGASTATAQVPIVNDSLLEGTETIAAIIANSSLGAVSIGTASATANITDNDTATATISATDSAAIENSANGGQFTITLSKTNNTGSAITVNYTVSGTATAGQDYTSIGASTSVANSASTATINVSTSGLDDMRIEGSETVIVTLDSTNHAQVSIGSPDNATVTIADDDVASVSITASGGSTNVTEGGVTDTHSVVIGTQPTSGQQVVITATPANAQINLGAGAGTAIEKTFTNADWDTPQTVTVTAVDDSLLESSHNSSVVYTINTTDTTESAYDTYSPMPTLNVAITDNDTATANLSASGGNESGPVAITYTVTLSKTNNTGNAITFDIDPNGGTATVTSDYTDFSGTTITVANGSSTGSTNVVVVNDSLLEGSETVIATISNSSLGIVTIGTDNATAGITDNDTATATIAANDATATENPATSGQFTVTLSKTNNTGSAITVNYSVTGTATASDDYAALSGTVSVSNGAATATIDVNTASLNDNSVEGDETVIVTLDSTNHGQVSVGSPSSATVTITDDDSPSVSITASGGSTNVTEGGATDTQSVVIGTQPAPGKQVVIRATPANSQINLGAGAGTYVEKTFTDADWSATQTITVTAVDDSLLESAHSSSVVYTINTTATDDPDYDAYATTLPTLAVAITDNDTATVSLSAVAGSETGPSSVTFTATLSKTNNTGSAITATLNPSGGTATATSDYANFASTTVTIANGASTGNALIAVVDDSLLEGTETVAGTLSSLSLGAVTIGTASATTNIVDNDATLATIVATDASAAENPSNDGQYTVYLDHVNNTGSAITVNYSVTGTATSSADYAALSGSVAVANGASTALINLPTTGLDDDIVEGNETAIVTLTSTNHSLVTIGNPGNATVTIADDDSFTMNLTAAQNGNEAGPVSVVYTATLSHTNTTGSAITATIADTALGTATSGDDYQAFGGTVSISDGQQSANYTVTVINDTDLEGLESVGAELSNPSEGDVGLSIATATITDNDTATATITASDATATENPASNGQFTITLSKVNASSDPIEFAYTSNGTATGGQDYATLSGSAMIASGQSNTVITVNTSGHNDSTHEGDETVIVSLSSSDTSSVTIGDPSQATVTIADDDPEATAAAKKTTTSVIKTVYVPTTVTDPETTTVEAPVEQALQPVDQVSIDLDNDAVSDKEEKKANNKGDGNGDGIPDSKQENVASLVSPVSNQPVTLEALGECTEIHNFAVVPESKLGKQDRRYRYPYGLIDYHLQCNKPGQTANVTVYYNAKYTIGQWRKFNASGSTFKGMQSVQSLVQPVGATDVTTVQYSLRDGGGNDDDGKADKRILDPAGPAVRAFYVFDLGWIVPVALGCWFIALSIRHRHKEYHTYHR